MVDLNQIRFEFIKANFRAKKNVQRGYEMFLAYRYKKQKLKKLLTHHSRNGIYSSSQVLFRDDIDFLIAYYSVLMASILSGYLNPTALVEAKDEGSIFLNHKEVKPYYNIHYQLILPKLFVKFIKDPEKFSEALSDFPNDPGHVFEEFLQLYRARMDDKDIDKFLFMLDEGEYFNSKTEKWITIDTIWGILTNENELIKFNSSEKQDKYIKGGILGFSKFMNYLIEISKIMALNKSPLFKAAIWQLDNYWLDKISNKRFEKIMSVFSSLKETIESGFEHQIYKSSTKEILSRSDQVKNEAIMEIENTKQAMRYLKDSDLGKPIEALMKNLKKPKH